jgi:hypothetical protein
VAFAIGKGKGMCRLICVAYGSNLHPVRLRKRVPSCRKLGAVRLEGYKLVFHKRSSDGSGKGNALKTGDPRDVLLDVAYSIPVSEKGDLDDAEGLGHGYIEESISIEVNGKMFPANLYVADGTAVDDTLAPYSWYKEMVLLGARHHAFPQEYIAQIEKVPSKEDPCIKRSKRELAIVEEIKKREPGNQPDRQ